MTGEQKIAVVRAMAQVGTAHMEDAEIENYLNMAKYAVLNRVFPFDNLYDKSHPETDADGNPVFPERELPGRYEMAQIRITVYNINKRGAEGETRHIEVGTQRDYASADIPDDLLNELVPMCGVPE